eukprot:PhM_4_TR157/c0_g1_i1/m.56297
MGLGLELIRHSLALDGVEERPRNYFHSSAWDYAVGHRVQYPGELLPKQAHYVSQIGGAAIVYSLLTARVTRSEFWSVGSLAILAMYFVSYKSHTNGNGAQGHSCGVWSAGLGLAGSSLRIMCGMGKQHLNVAVLAWFLFQMWYDAGRFQVWGAHYAKFVTETKLDQIQLHSLFDKFLNNPLAKHAVNFMPLKVKDEVAEVVAVEAA